MFRNNRIYVIIIATLFVLLIALQHKAPKPVDWRETYNVQSKSPYGCFVLNGMLKPLFPEQTIEYNDAGFFVSLDSNSVDPLNLIVVTSKFAPDEYDIEALLKFVYKGNDLFVSSSSYGERFLDRFKIKLTSSIIDNSQFKSGKEVLYLENQEFSSDSGYYFDKKMPLVSISEYDLLNSLKLGTNREGKTNFISIRHGLGKIYLHTQPLVFTNYHLLYGNVEYASNVLSYLPIRKTAWDNYYKPDRLINLSPMRYILSQPPLQLAYYLLLCTLLFYMVLESKRKQRIVPVIKVPENRSLQFVNTVGGLYFKQHDNADLARKKFIYFKEFLREHYYISTISASSECIAQVSAKSGVPVKLVGQIIESSIYFETVQTVSDLALIELNHKMEMFFEQCL